MGTPVAGPHDDTLSSSDGEMRSAEENKWREKERLIVAQKKERTAEAPKDSRRLVTRRVGMGTSADRLQTSQELRTPMVDSRRQTTTPSVGLGTPGGGADKGAPLSPTSCAEEGKAKGQRARRQRAARLRAEAAKSEGGKGNKSKADEDQDDWHRWPPRRW
jgi:hypothetical protein